MTLPQRAGSRRVLRSRVLGAVSVQAPASAAGCAVAAGNQAGRPILIVATSPTAGCWKTARSSVGNAGRAS